MPQVWETNLPTEDRLPRKLAAILYADVAGYSRLTGEDEEGTHRRLSDYLDLISTAIQNHNGNVVHYAGDAVLADFRTVSEALGCAIAIQANLEDKNADLADDRKIQFRIGVNLGEVIVDRDDIYGDGVNVAARLEGLAEPGGVCISESVQTAIGNKLPLDYEFLGEQQVKNIVHPVMVYHARLKPSAQLPSPARPKRLKRSSIRVAAMVAIATLVIGVGTVWSLLPWRQPAEPIPSQDQIFSSSGQPSIAVLPFDNFSGDSSLNYLSDGISEGIINALARSPHLLIMSRTSSFAYKGKAVTAQQVGEQLNVDYVLEGSVQKGHDNVRVIGQLVDADTGHQLWAESFDQESDDVLAIQDAVSEKITQSLGYPEGTVLRKVAGRKAWMKEKVELKEYDYMLRGHEYHLRYTKDDIARALKIYEEGLERFPDSALLRTKVGWVFVAQAFQRWSEDPERKLQQATALAKEALVDDRAPLIAQYLAHRLLGWLYAVGAHEIDRGLVEMKAAVSLVPGSGRARADLGSIQMYAGLIDEGLRNLEIAERSDPGYPRIALHKAWGFRMQGKYKEAVQALERYHVQTFDKYLLLSSCYVNLSELDEAKLAAAEAMKLYPGLSVSTYGKLIAFTDQRFVEEYLDDLRKAGLPE